MKCLFKIEDYKHEDLSKCEWFTYKNSIYFTNNIIHPKYSVETWWGFVLRVLRLKKYITYGKPKEVNIGSKKELFNINNNKNAKV